MASRNSKVDARQVAEDAIDSLKKDPHRMRTLLRNAAELGDEIAHVVTDAGHDDAADRIRSMAKKVRGATLLPAPIAAALLKKALGKIVESLD